MIDRVQLLQTGIFGLYPSMLKARKIPVAFRVLNYSLYSTQKNRDLQPTKILLNAHPQGTTCLPPFSPFHRQEESHGKTKSIPQTYSAFLNKAENRRGNQAMLPLHIHIRKTKRMLAELLFQIFRFDIHTSSLPFKVQQPMSRTLFHSRTESLVG